MRINKEITEKKKSQIKKGMLVTILPEGTKVLLPNGHKVDIFHESFIVRKQELEDYLIERDKETIKNLKEK